MCAMCSLWCFPSAGGPKGGAVQEEGGGEEAAPHCRPGQRRRGSGAEQGRLRQGATQTVGSLY